MIWSVASTLPISPLWKIPLACTSVGILHVGWKPPTPMVETQETTKYSAKASTTSVNAALRRIAAVGRGVFWAYALCETITVLANANPSSEATAALSWLARDPEFAANVRITPAWLMGCALMSLGHGIRIACHRSLGKFFTWELSVKEDQRLITTGPYAIVRHPSYLGMFLGDIGVYLCHVGPGSWARECGWLDTTGGKIAATIWFSYVFGVLAMLFWRVPVEDKVLQKEFGAEWEVWAKKTPYKLIPFIY